jgi:hypothetical protein
MISRVTYETKLQKSMKNRLLEIHSVTIEIHSVTKQGLLIGDSEARYVVDH